MLTTLALLAAGAVLVTPQAENRRDPPEWVQRILEQQFAHAELVEFRREGDHDYEAKLRRKDDRRPVEVEMDELAGVTDIDEDLDPERLPERIVQALKRAFPKAEIRKGTRRTDIHVSYKIHITMDGRKRAVRISPHGKILEIEKGD